MVIDVAEEKGQAKKRGNVEGFWSCQCVCQRIPCQPQHLVAECRVLPAKHNSSVSSVWLSFHKARKITRNHIHMWENKRERARMV